MLPLAHAEVTGRRLAVAGLAFTAANLEPAARTLEGAVPPLHACTATQADLDDLAGRVGSHASTLDREEDGYDCLCPAPWPSG